MKFFGMLLFVGISGCAPTQARVRMPLDLRKDPSALSEAEVHNEFSWLFSGCWDALHKDMDNPASSGLAVSDVDWRIASCRLLATDKNYSRALHERVVSLHPEWTTQEKSSVLKGALRVGQKEEHVRGALGNPDSINRTTVKGGRSEQFIYGNLLYVYLLNGRVTGWQDNLKK